MSGVSGAPRPVPDAVREHLLALRASVSGRLGVMHWVVFAFVGAMGVLLIHPALTSSFPLLPGTTYFGAAAIPAAGTVIGSVAMWRRRQSVVWVYARIALRRRRAWRLNACVSCRLAKPLWILTSSGEVTRWQCAISPSRPARPAS